MLLSLTTIFSSIIYINIIFMNIWKKNKNKIILIIIYIFINKLFYFNKKKKRASYRDRTDDLSLTKRVLYH